MKILRITAPVLTVATERLASTVAFYEQTLGETVRARFRNPMGSLDLVLIGSMLLIAGSPAARATRSELKATLIVDSLEEWVAEVTRQGALIVEGPAPGPMSDAGPVGSFMLVRHPDGHLFEYFQPKGGGGGDAGSRPLTN
jgi:catechol 2,3-dioxygenase-like lactoylglutathione lyase family enzyme